MVLENQVLSQLEILPTALCCRQRAALHNDEFMRALADRQISADKREYLSPLYRQANERHQTIK
jgi:hypothetical protein